MKYHIHPEFTLNRSGYFEADEENLAEGIRDAIKKSPTARVLVEALSDGEVSLAYCKNPECPIGCPDSHSIDFPFDL